MNSVAESPIRSAIVTYGGTGISVILATLQSIIVLPLLAASVDSRLLGAFLATNELLTWLQSADFGVPNLLIQRISGMKGEAASRRAHQHFSFCMYFLLAASIVVSMIFCLSFELLMPLVGFGGTGSQSARSAILLSFFVGIANILLNGPLAYARALHRTASVSAFLILGSIASLVTGATIAYQGGGVWTLPVAGAARAVLVAIGCGIFLRSYISTGKMRILARPRRGQMLFYTRRLPVSALALLSHAVLNNSDGLLITLTLGPGFVAPVIFTRKIMDLCRVFLDQIGTASFAPFSRLAQQARTTEAVQLFKLEVQVVVVVGALCAYWFNIIGPTIVKVWAGERMSAGFAFIAVYGLAVMIQTASSLTGMMVRAAGDIFKGAALLSFELSVKVVLAAPMLLFVGVVALPIALIISSLASLALATTMLGDKLKVPLVVWVSKILFVGTLVVLAAVCLAWSCRASDLKALLAISASCFCLVILALSRHYARISDAFVELNSSSNEKPAI
jgi:O-antigen/teichoic acid export membrane protein